MWTTRPAMGRPSASIRCLRRRYIWLPRLDTNQFPTYEQRQRAPRRLPRLLNNAKDLASRRAVRGAGAASLLAKDLLGLARIEFHVITQRRIERNQLDVFHGALLLGEVGAGGVPIKGQNQSLSFSRQNKIDE
jgi:hypothetical protein